MKRTLLAIGALLASGMMPLWAQTITPELRPFVGAYMPTGAMSNVMKSSALFGMQGALEVNPNLHVIGTLGWAPAHNKFTGYDENVNIFSYDIGAELGLVRPMGSGWEFKPFFGLGGGARTYDYKATGFPTHTSALGYLSAGSEFQLNPVALRVEARANAYDYKSPVTNVSANTRNDIALLFGFAYHFR